MDELTRPRVHIEFDHNFDPVDWGNRYSAGQVPNELPYGFHHLIASGFDLQVRAAGRSWLINRAVGGTFRRLTGGFEFVDAIRSPSRRACDVAVCWNERTGVPAAARTVIPGEPPAVMGSIWMTDPHADIPKRSMKFAKWALRRASAVWANTDMQLKVLTEFGVPRDRAHLLLNPGIDSMFWHNERDEPANGLVLSVGNDRHRDHDYLVEIMGQVQQRLPGSRLKLITAQPVNFPAKLGVKLDHVTHPQLRSMYSESAVVAVALTPNIHVSGCTSILEAMACERPVVVTAYEGYERYVDHGKTGYLIAPGDKGAFVDALCELLEDPERARQMGHAGRQAVDERFSSEHFMSELGKVLHSVLR
ncbi:glycosyltransferase family 4 protein [Mycolicibacterium chlorophenolicum]|uniref:Putative glycosyltransferase EpsD n=1 Tax=Mycolicibacterium chlorophenolicum TaxID=37916 RepID=A0A0J6VLQ1_9MYCO|nr:glycosyltransferase family 4 protein [Mycolicibacterium chlorophenolicum]KMO71154.1 putative glycosyltransferase EpsD [Mycolicibacterium chlorophenolicum]